MPHFLRSLRNTWPLIGTWFVVCLTALYTDGIAVIWQGLVYFIQGNSTALQQTPYEYAMLLPAVTGALALALPLIGALNALIRFCTHQRSTGQPDTLGVRKLDGATVHILRATAGQDIVDELFARGFLLGLLVIPLSAITSPTAAFYTLFLIGFTPKRCASGSFPIHIKLRGNFYRMVLAQFSWQSSLCSSAYWHRCWCTYSITSCLSAPIGSPRASGKAFGVFYKVAS